MGDNVEDSQKALWVAVRRALLMIVPAILLIVRAIERTHKLKRSTIVENSLPPE